VVVKPRAARTPTIAAQQVRGHTAFVQKHILAGVVERLRVSPLSALSCHVSAALFVGVYRFL
jgi:hypothetical protein